MLPGGGRASLIASLRRFYLALFLVFLLLTLFAAYIYFEADLSAVNQRAIASNFEAFRQIEFENEKQLSKLRENLGKEAQFTTFESVERFRTNYEKINQRLLVDYLSQRELRLVHLNEVKPPLLILPFNLYRKEFERLSHSIQDIFSEVRWVRAMDLVGFPKDDLPIWESLSSLKIKPVIDLDRQRILLRRKDFEKLDDLDGVQDLRFSNQVFNENICWRILRVGSDDLIKYDADDFLGKRRASPHYFSSLSDLESPMQWSVLFLMRKISRLGKARHVFARFVEGSSLERTAEVRGEFYETSNRQFLWNYFPPDYLEEPEDQELLLLLPEQFVVASIDHLRLCRSFLPAILRDHSPSFGVQVDFPNEPNYFFHFQKGVALAHKVDSFLLRKEVSHVIPAQGISIPIEKAEGWVQDIFDGKGSEDPGPVHFEARNSSNQGFFASSYYSGSLNGSRVMIYQPTSLFMKPFQRKWALLLILYSLIMTIFFLQLRKQETRLSGAIEACLRFLVADRDPGEEGEFRIPTEIIRVQETMRKFNLAIEEKRSHAELDLGFQRILNIPRKNIDFYLEEFYYFTGLISEDLRWRLCEAGGEVPKERLLSIELDSSHRRFLEEILHRPPEIFLEFFKSQNQGIETRRLFQRNFCALVDKAALEHHSMEAEKIAAEIEVAGEIQTVLVPEVPRYGYVDFQFVLPELSAEAGILIDHGEVEGKLHFYLAELNLKGTPASLAAVHVKAFLEGIRRMSPSAGSALSSLNDFLVEREIPDLLLSITYGVFDPGNSVISYATGGHEARLLKSRGKCHSKNTGGIPLGVFPSRNFQQQDLILVSGDLFVIVSRSFLHQSSERTWLQRDEALNHWLVSQGEQLLKPHANALPPRPGNQASPLSLLCLGKSGARA